MSRAFWLTILLLFSRSDDAGHAAHSVGLLGADSRVSHGGGGAAVNARIFGRVQDGDHIAIGERYDHKSGNGSHTRMWSDCKSRLHILDFRNIQKKDASPCLGLLHGLVLQMQCRRQRI